MVRPARSIRNAILRHGYATCGDSEASDIDMLVEFEPGRSPGLLGIAGMEIELSELLGRKVDLRTQGDLSRYFRDAVVAAAVIQYERG